MDIKTLANAALEAIRGGNTNAGSSIDSVNKYAASKFGNILADSTGGIGAAASAQDAAEKAATSLQLQRLKDQQDPSKWQKIRKADGGFDYLDPAGNKVSVSQFAQATGQTRAQALDGSENPLDQQFLNDYNNLQDLTTDINNNDTTKIATFLENHQNIDPNTKPQDLMKELVKKYPHIFGTGTYQQSLENLNKPLFQAGQIGGVGGSSSSGSTGISSTDYGY